MGFPELLALSLAGNIILGFAFIGAKSKLERAIHSLIEVGEGRAEISRVAGGIAVTHKIIKDDKANNC